MHAVQKDIAFKEPILKRWLWKYSTRVLEEKKSARLEYQAIAYMESRLWTLGVVVLDLQLIKLGLGLKAWLKESQTLCYSVYIYHLIAFSK